MPNITRLDVCRGRWNEASRITDALTGRRDTLLEEIALAERQGLEAGPTRRRLRQTAEELREARRRERAAQAALDAEQNPTHKTKEHRR